MEAHSEEKLICDKFNLEALQPVAPGFQKEIQSVP
jgi:hypothetical protein